MSRRRRRSTRDYARVARELRQPQHLWHLPLFRAVRATMTGDYEEAERLADEARRGGERAQEPLAGAAPRRPDGRHPPAAGAARGGAAGDPRDGAPVPGDPRLAADPERVPGRARPDRGGAHRLRALRRRRVRRDPPRPPVAAGDDPPRGHLPLARRRRTGRGAARDAQAFHRARSDHRPRRLVPGPGRPLPRAAPAHRRPPRRGRRQVRGRRRARVTDARPPERPRGALRARAGACGTRPARRPRAGARGADGEPRRRGRHRDAAPRSSARSPRGSRFRGSPTSMS